MLWSVTKETINFFLIAVNLHEQAKEKEKKDSKKK